MFQELRQRYSYVRSFAPQVLRTLSFGSPRARNEVLQCLEGRQVPPKPHSRSSPGAGPRLCCARKGPTAEAGSSAYCPRRERPSAPEISRSWVAAATQPGTAASIARSLMGGEAGELARRARSSHGRPRLRRARAGRPRRGDQASDAAAAEERLGQDRARQARTHGTQADRGARRGRGLPRTTSWRPTSSRSWTRSTKSSSSMTGATPRWRPYWRRWALMMPLTC